MPSSKLLKWFRVVPITVMLLVSGNLPPLHHCSAKDAEGKIISIPGKSRRVTLLLDALLGENEQFVQDALAELDVLGPSILSEAIPYFETLSLREENTPRRVEQLIEKLRNKEAHVRNAAQEDLISIGSPAILPLTKALNGADSADFGVRAQQILKAIEIGLPNEALFADRLSTAIHLVASHKDPRFRDSLVRFARHPQEKVCHMACKVLPNFPHPENRSVFLEVLRSESLSAAGCAAQALTFCASADDIDPILALKAKMVEQNYVFAPMNEALKRLPIDENPERALKRYRDAEAAMRPHCLSVLPAESAECRKAVVEALTSEQADLREGAARIMRRKDFAGDFKSLALAFKAADFGFGRLVFDAAFARLDENPKSPDASAFLKKAVEDLDSLLAEHSTYAICLVELASRFPSVWRPGTADLATLAGKEAILDVPSRAKLLALMNPAADEAGFEAFLKRSLALESLEMQTAVLDALEKWNSPKTPAYLQQLISLAQDDWISAQAFALLTRKSGPALAWEMLAVLKGRNLSLHAAALRKLAELDSDALEEQLVEHLKSPLLAGTLTGLRALYQRPEIWKAEIQGKFLLRLSASVGIAEIQAIAKVFPDTGSLMAELAKADNASAEKLLYALAFCGAEVPADGILKYSNHDSEALRLASAVVLSRVDPKACLEACRNMLDKGSAAEKALALCLLGDLGDAQDSALIVKRFPSLLREDKPVFVFYRGDSKPLCYRALKALASLPLDAGLVSGLLEVANLALDSESEILLAKISAKAFSKAQDDEKLQRASNAFYNALSHSGRLAFILNLDGNPGAVDAGHVSDFLKKEAESSDWRVRSAALLKLQRGGKGAGLIAKDLLAQSWPEELKILFPEFQKDPSAKQWLSDELSGARDQQRARACMELLLREFEIR